MTRIPIYCLLAACFLGTVCAVMAQEPTGSTPVKAAPPSGVSTFRQPSKPNIANRNLSEEPPSVWLWTQSIIATALLLFAASTTWIIFRLVKEAKEISDRVFKMYTLNIVVFVGTLLIVIGFSDSQIAPMMGLLGTIVGYILGSPHNKSTSTVPEPPTGSETRPAA
jgi:hypothetical protein